MQHNSVTLKVTIAGRKLIHIIAILQSGDEDKVRRFIERNYAASIQRERTTDDIFGEWWDLYEETGGLDVYKVFTIQRFSAYIVVKARKTDHYYLMKLKLDDLPPHNILELEFALPPEQDDF